MLKKLLILDRDGTIIQEPKENLQVDSLEKLEFLPHVIQCLARIARELHYTLVLATNQDGLGTSSFPEKDFLLPHNTFLKTLENEGIRFESMLIDKSFEHENKPTRKPATGMFKQYLESKEVDWEKSIVVGDRLTDIELAKNLNAKGILLNFKNLKIPSALEPTLLLQTTDWFEVLNILFAQNRKIKLKRETKETHVNIDLSLDGEGKFSIDTGLHFFNHMLEQLAKHSEINLSLKVKGDLQVDEHHTIEDTGLALGSALSEALGERRGIARYGFMLPMDDCVSFCAIDLGGRPWLVWEVEFTREKIGDVPTEMFYHFFKSLSDQLKANIFIQCKGENEHHKIESIFKAFAKSLLMAKKQIPFKTDLPTTKGVL